MKIVVSNFGRQYCNDMLKALDRKGWLGVFFTSFASNNYVDRHFPKRIRYFLQKRAFAGIPGSKIIHHPVLFFVERLVRDRSPRLARALGDFFDRWVAAKLAKYKPELVLSYENTNRATMKAAKQLGITTVLDLAQIHHNDIAEYAKWFMTPEQWQEEVNIVNPRKTEALQYTDYVLTLSSFAAASMRRNGWPENRLFTVNLGIDPARFAPKKTYTTGKPLRLLFVGTMTRRKGLGVLFEALRRLHEIPVTLTLIGPMADAGDLLQANAGHFRYLPFLHHEDLARHYQEADVFVFPSLLDSWAQTVLEAMACGTPAIVTENTGAKDAVARGGGWIIPPNDPEALCRQINYLDKHPEAIETTGRLARIIAEQYTWRHYAEQVEEVLKTISRRENIPL